MIYELDPHYPGFPNPEEAEPETVNSSLLLKESGETPPAGASEGENS